MGPCGGARVPTAAVHRAHQLRALPVALAAAGAAGVGDRRGAVGAVALAAGRGRVRAGSVLDGGHRGADP